MRLDAVACYLQDVASDDAADVGLDDCWVLRRMTLWVAQFPEFRDEVDLLTWCSGVAASAAERHTTVSVDGRPFIEAVALWVFVGPDGRPARLDRHLFAAAGIPTGQRISTRLHLDVPDPDAPGARRREWPLRAADTDLLRHVNNAVSLAVVEDVLRDEGQADAALPWIVEVEYRAPIDPGERPVLTWSRESDGSLAGAVHCGGAARTTFRVRFSDDGLDHAPPVSRHDAAVAFPDAPAART